jgi:predicted AAA+ superfamily ATPase
MVIFKRKITDLLDNWKKSHKHVLIIEGARQVGKTYVVKDFGSKNYKDIVMINFIESPDAKNIFVQDLQAERIIHDLSLYANVPISKNTLIFLDEIQECKEAIASLKFLDIANYCDIIASGSLMGIRKKESMS